MIDAKIVKIGNSQGIRLNRRDLDSMGLGLGDQVKVVIKRKQGNSRHAVAALEAIARLNGRLANIDVEDWQSERRKQADERERQLRGILGR